MLQKIWYCYFYDNVHIIIIIIIINPMNKIVYFQIFSTKYFRILKNFAQSLLLYLAVSLRLV